MEGKLGYPMFVKPANCGSSVGVSKAKATCFAVTFTTSANSSFITSSFFLFVISI
ncbi:hypothetical protein [Ruminococcus sp.]|uniref:hypothetical protein n=1 Tax=Ruminococcus sp. TaxID=41978 RepID=UPI003AEF257B